MAASSKSRLSCFLSEIGYAGLSSFDFLFYCDNGQSTPAQEAPMDYLKGLTDTFNPGWMINPSSTTPIGKVKLGRTIKKKLTHGLPIYRKQCFGL